MLLPLSRILDLDHMTFYHQGRWMPPPLQVEKDAGCAYLDSMLIKLLIKNDRILLGKDLIGQGIAIMSSYNNAPALFFIR
jgi:hypothetical protein